MNSVEEQVADTLFRYARRLQVHRHPPEPGDVLVFMGTGEPAWDDLAVVVEVEGTRFGWIKVHSFYGPCTWTNAGFTNYGRALGYEPAPQGSK